MTKLDLTMIFNTKYLALFLDFHFVIPWGGKHNKLLQNFGFIWVPQKTLVHIVNLKLPLIHTNKVKSLYECWVSIFLHGYTLQICITISAYA